MLPPLTDFTAMLGISLVLSSLCMRLLHAGQTSQPWAKGLTALCFAVMWVPVGPANLPVVAFVRGITSDLSITCVLLACIDLCQRLFELAPTARREQIVVYAVIAPAAVFLYPLALGWGDWDAYRLGWNATPLWVCLLATAVFAWLRHLTLLPTLIAFALLGWTLGVMESTNLWDYLMDPWLAIAALVICIKSGFQALRRRTDLARRQSA